jgi:hypothetical protein
MRCADTCLRLNIVLHGVTSFHKAKERSRSLQKQLLGYSRGSAFCVHESTQGWADLHANPVHLMNKLPTKGRDASMYFFGCLVTWYVSYLQHYLQTHCLCYDKEWHNVHRACKACAGRLGFRQSDEALRCRAGSLAFPFGMQGLSPTNATQRRTCTDIVQRWNGASRSVEWWTVSKSVYCLLLFHCHRQSAPLPEF